jgi:RNA polymerase sigma-70 factor, ECF subfamily
LTVHGALAPRTHIGESSQVEAFLSEATHEAEKRLLLVIRQMRALVGPHPDLDDLVQDALVELESSKFRGEAKFSTFTHSVCYRVWVRHLRWNSRLKRKVLQFFGDDLPDFAGEGTPEIDCETKQRYERLYRALEAVSPLRRAVVVMHDLEGLDVAEVARIVEAKETTVRSRLRDGRAMLADILRNDPDFGDMRCRASI